MLENARNGLDWHYLGVSPQLLARVRLNWSALGFDLDAFWRESVQRMPGFRDLDAGAGFADSRPIDLLLLFDQGFVWVDTLRRALDLLHAAPSDSRRLTAEQIAGTRAICARLRDELAAVRTLALSGIAVPAMQISRAISEDVDLGLALLVRRRLAADFTACRGPEEAAEFWRRNIAGGRAFRLVAQALYRYGLDFSDDTEYGRWRKEVLVFLGSAVHSSFPTRGLDPADAGPLNAAAQECLNFTTIRMQEMCAYGLVLGRDLRDDLGELAPAEPADARRVRFARMGGEIIIDQMRWLTDTAGSPVSD